MKIRRIKKIKINCWTFNVVWNNKHNGGCFNYLKDGGKIEIGTKGLTDEEILMIISHELMEIVTCEMNVRLARPDCDSDYIFVYDHRQHETITRMFSGLLAEFIQ